MHDSVDHVLTRTTPRLRAQVLDPSRWFIPAQNTEIPPFTAGNEVTPLIDGKDALAAMHDAFGRGRENGYIYITDWDLVPEIRLLGARGGGRFDDNLTRARAAGADVRIILWLGNAVRRHRLRSSTEPWGRVFLDNKTHALTGSHHQKSAVVKAGEERLAFVGGIDITYDRWDTPAHVFPDPDGQYEDRKPWHDVHTRIRGPAAADVEANFRQRWNDQHRRPADRVAVHPVSSPAVGTHLVQLLRTVPVYATHWVASPGTLPVPLNLPEPFDFTTGEFGYRQAYAKAIANARDYVYIEDQYFISDEIGGHLAAAMRRSPRLQILVVTAAVPDQPRQRWNDAFDFHQNRVISALRAADPARVNIFHLTNPAGTDIYCHAKVCIIDDIYAVIGSCNISRRSLTNDTELGIAVLDEFVEHGRRKFARELRIRLWQEHLGLTAAELSLIDDPLAGIAQWNLRAGAPPAQARRHARPAGSDVFEWDSEVDPDGTS